jgi:chromosome segregation protein
VRLTHIKLAGFKSFVDPTHLALPGRLIGVVGPNGCGKSNVIDAVRWVLGESSAKHLRGETMEDVIFNGSGERKPVNRASVELVFDNSQGKASGPWSQYGEIAIKRVLERDGGSHYFINNTPVRRRDVADIFLGTGLGARAYAIIEQGMISRVVEAKPEELRIFLEEAAGVSKYRERRKETEGRLEDTRENLLRVDDIRRELEAQISRLEAQAEAAEKFRSLEAETRRTQCLLWAIRKQDAGTQRIRFARELDQLAVEIEQATAALREAERRLETQREAHYAASDQVHAAQGRLYETNAELARVEQELNFLRSNRTRAETRVADLERQILEQTERQAQLERTLADLREQLQGVGELAETRRAALEAVRVEQPAAEQAYREARAEAERTQAALAEVRRRLEVEATQRGHSEKVIQQLDLRVNRLAEERDALVVPDEAQVEELRALRMEVEARIDAMRQEQADVEARLPQLEEAYRATARGVESARQNLASLEARRHALVDLQQQVGASEQMSTWLAQHGLSDLPRLWERVRVRAGWEDAVEAVLRERLNAIAVTDPDALTDWFGASPPGKLSVYRTAPGPAPEPAVAPHGWQRLTDYVEAEDPAVLTVLREWLDGVFAVEAAGDAVQAAAALVPGQLIVTREGHVFTAHSIGFHAADSEIHGLLQRKQQIEQLEREIPEVQAALAADRERLTALESELEEGRRTLDGLRRRLAELAQQRHETELDEMRVSQALERARHRHAQIEAELAELHEQRGREALALQTALDRLARLGEEERALQEAVNVAAQRYREADRAVSEVRERVLRAEREAQETQFAERSLVERCNDLEHTLTANLEQIERARAQLSQAQTEVAEFDEAPLASRMDEILATKAERDRALGAARDVLAEAERSVRATDQERMETERRIEPMRARLGELRLKEQEARLAEENFAAQLAEARADEAALLAAVEGRLPRPGALQGELNRLNEEIAALGPVNLAALDELKTAQERKTFLDAQSADLTAAMETLQEAIRRIDRETRERLQATFDEVNANLAEMFPALFGGGEAKLVMSGEEILDSGVQIVARPPGKKNSSIHLLSGGEKALTAVALVFSMFKLNPAPFCLLDEVDAPLDDTNTGRFCDLVRKMSEHTQFIFISHNKITMEMAEQLIGVTMPELGVSRIVAVDVEEALRMRQEKAA